MTMKRWRTWVCVGTLLVASTALLVAQARTAGDSDEVGRLAAALKVGAGSRVADVGAGRGNFAFRFAKLVGPTGHVFATEISDTDLGRMRSAVERDGLSNVTVVEVAEDDSRLPELCCDAIYLRNVYHHLTRPKPTVNSLFRAMKPGGRLAIIDFEPSGRAVDGVPSNRGGHGVRPALVSEELTAAGFREIERVSRWRGNDFLVLFEKPAR